MLAMHIPYRSIALSIFSAALLFPSALPMLHAQSPVDEGGIDGAVILDEPVIPEVVDSASVEESVPSEDHARTELDAAFAARSPLLAITQSDGVIADGNYVYSPGRTYISGLPGEEKTVTITILSRMGEDAIFELLVRDTSVDPKTGAVVFLPQAKDGPYSAKRWIYPEAISIPLHHGEQVSVTVSVRIPEKADAGDHMASVLLKRKNLDAGNGGIRVNPMSSSLFVITVLGDVVEDASFTGLSPAHRIFWKTPVELLATVQNRGTVHVSPEGTISISNIFGVKVDEIAVQRWKVLRESQEIRQLRWEPTFALGLYTARTDWKLSSPGTKGQLPLEQRVTRFWVIPLLPLIIVLLAVFFVSYLVQLFFQRFEIHAKGGGGSRSGSDN